MSMQAIYEAMQVQALKGHTLNEVVGGGDPMIVGRECFNYITSTAALSVDSRVFEIGSGCGRTSTIIADYLSGSPNRKGRYVGIDIIPGLVDFCVKSIEPEYPLAKFYLSEDKNPQYDRLVKKRESVYQELKSSQRVADIDGDTFVTGESSERFDLVLAFSVFTHLAEAETKLMSNISTIPS